VKSVTHAGDEAGPESAPWEQARAESLGECCCRGVRAGSTLDLVGKGDRVRSGLCLERRSTALPQRFPGRKATAGNMAFPFSPSDLRAGSVHKFSFCHLVQLLDAERRWKTENVCVGGSCG
jgi:hypothetical protein